MAAFGGVSTAWASATDAMNRSVMLADMVAALRWLMLRTQDWNGIVLS